MQAIVRVFSWLLLVSLFTCVAPAARLQFSFESLGDNLFRIQYDVTGVELYSNQELAIEFDPAVYRSLANPVTTSDFDVLLFQPGDPLGAFGRLSALALVDHPSLSGGFSVDVETTALRVPGVQTFAINQLDELGVIVARVAEGQTVAATPEPGSLVLTASALLLACVVPAWRRRLRKQG